MPWPPDPKQAFRVVIIVPPGYPHSSCFIEVAVLLKSALLSLGLPCDIACNEFKPDAINILLGGHLLRWEEGLKRHRYIAYQLEQLSANEGAYCENLRLILSGAAAVWDYSLENIAFLESCGIRAIQAPVGYHPVLERIKHAQVKDIDILFYGSVNERRKTIIDRLKAIPGVRAEAFFGVYGPARDEYIGRSKIILNVHHYSTKIFESVRVSYLLNNRCCVVSEESEVFPYTGVDVPMAPYEGLVDACVGLLQDSAVIDALRQRTYEQFKSAYPMAQIVKEALNAA